MGKHTQEQISYPKGSALIKNGTQNDKMTKKTGDGRINKQRQGQ